MKRVQFIRYTTPAMSLIVGRDGEIMVNLSTRAAVVHDGVTEGGFEQARADMSNVPDATSSDAGRMSTAHVVSLATVIAGLAAEITNRTNADASKTDKVIPATPNNIAVLTSGGNLGDSGLTIAQINFPAGTKMVFAQATAPAGWTQDASDDAVLRVVSTAGGGTGGSLSVTAPHTHTTGDHTLVEAEIPAHAHSTQIRNTSQGVGGGSGTGTPATLSAQVSSSTGGGTAHNHGVTGAAAALKYNDVIFATKD